MTTPKHKLNENEIDKVPRTILPIPDRSYSGEIFYDAKDPAAKFDPIKPLRPPKNAPNVLVVLIDDTGFGAASTFGGPCETPTADRLAKEGLAYNRFHTTALCSPTRAALLSGRNHHMVGMACITEGATSATGYTSLRPNTCATFPDILRMNGYATAQFGKCHEVPTWETSPAGPFDRWPTGSGFQYFFGFVGGETNQYYPTLYEGTTAIRPNKTPEEGYHLVEDMSTRSIAWVKQHQALVPDQPFLLYFAPGATHAPHHVPKDWIDKYKGKFDQGWDKLREEIFARQKKMGIVPKDCKLTERHQEVPAWEDMPKDLRAVLCREMEVYAAYLSYCDHHVGLLIDSLKELSVLDDTLIYYIIGDNGASAEGTPKGTYNELITLNGAGDLETDEYLKSKIEKLGSPEAYNHYAVGWAHAMCTPYQWTKQVASHWGGTRNGTIVHWPNGIKARGEIRSQFTHVIDVAATVLEAAGIPEPLQVNGVTQVPIQGTSMLYSFDDVAAPERHTTQYFEIFCNRGIYHKGWSAITKHRTPWETGIIALPSFDKDVWELYDGSKDWTQAHDLSQKMPEKLKELQRLFIMEAERNNVFPLDDRVAERLNPDLAGRPTLIKGDSQILYGGMERLNESSMINIKNKSHSITAEVENPEQESKGVIINQGGDAGGWALYVNDGKLTYCYNYFGIDHFIISSQTTLPSGKHTLKMDFDYDGGGLGKGGTVTLYCDKKKIASGRVEHTQAMFFSADETTDIGQDSSAPVSPDYTAGNNAFNGKISLINIEVGNDSYDHLIRPEDRERIAMSRQ